MELKDLVGEHVLSGVDFESSNHKYMGDLYRDCETVNFVLDGETYTAVQDPNDGYRSCMREIRKSDVKVSNMFEPCRVVGTMDTVMDIINFFDTHTGEIVLSIGTDYSDQWYPHWIAKFSPENMTTNQHYDLLQASQLMSCRK